jgi:cytochrome c peroxidase
MSISRADRAHHPVAAAVAACVIIAAAAASRTADGEEARPHAPVATPAAAFTPAFTPEEIAAIVQHGPWPVPVGRDPGNRVSGSSDAIEFGRLLFSSRLLSGNRQHACSDCHDPSRHFTDGKPRGRAGGETDRNTPTLFNQRLNRWYGWAGRSDSLWAQSIHPILDARELGATPAQIAGRIAAQADLAVRYRRSFGRPIGQVDPQLALVDVAKALAAWQETLVTGRTPFDAFRDALAAGRSEDVPAIAQYPAPAKRGLRIFIGKGQCRVCHFGPLFSNGEFHAIGVSHFIRPGEVDGGRYAAIEALRSSPYNLLGEFNDDPQRANAIFTRHVQQHPRNWGEFRVPSLREVARTAPYMHDGSLATLADVIRHYSNVDESRLHADGELLLRPLGLSVAEAADLIAFLETLATR